ncbi:hypothetical protein [Planktothrix paucivesiculata]|uniref:Uncharacterized protein n=1 Tax=Planktothrix paucivesiculata PCC 9631 TaxID=671071 RepID=A0A7Z9BZJ5_9CYAN|nr:hypothetical protein [Planktothrix paucivesiculata]VXD24516.1 hypothetical protein PL9631_810028 [Planktothrix paucivesiculata PCC 9631]
MKVRLKKQNRQKAGSVNPTGIQAESLTDIRPMDNHLTTPQKPQTEDINHQQIQKNQGFNFAEISIFAGGAQGLTPKIQPKFFDRPENITQQSSIPIIQRKLSPDQIKHANRIRKARGLDLLPIEAAKQLNNVEEATGPAPAANQPVANQQPTQTPHQSDAKRSESNFQVVHDYSGIKSTFKELKSWDKVKEQFSSDQKTMWQLFDFRQWYVDSLISVLRDTYPGLIAQSVGSADPTSDYDITISTPGSGKDVEAIKWFNAQVRKEFGVEPGTVFDTNLYAKNYLKVEENIDNQAAMGEQKPDQNLEQVEGEFGKIASLSHDMAALVKQRRYMKQVEWDNYVNQVVNNITDPEQQKFTRNQYEEADSIYQIAASELLGEVKQEINQDGMSDEKKQRIQEHTKLGKAEEEVLSQLPNNKYKDEIRKQLLGAEELQAITHEDSDLVLKKSNELYLDRMAKVRQLQQTIHKLGTGEPTKVEALKAQVQQMLGEAYFYAAEAYHSEGAVKHIVAGVQGAKNPNQKAAVMNSLKPEHFLQSFNEQLGDFLKDLSHYANAHDGKIFYRSSKYLYRLFLAVAELRQYKFKDFPSLQIESKTAHEIAKDIDSQLVAIRKGNKKFDSEDEKNQAAVDTMKEILGVQTASDLKVKILTMAQEFNVKVRSQITELSTPGENTSKDYFTNIQ